MKGTAAAEKTKEAPWPTNESMDQGEETIFAPNISFHQTILLERFSKPNIRFGSGRTGSKIVSKFRLTHNRKLRSANRNTIDHTIACPALLLWCPAVEIAVLVSQRSVLCQTVQVRGTPSECRESSITGTVPWPTPLAHSFTDDDRVPAENLLPK